MTALPDGVPFEHAVALSQVMRKPELFQQSFEELLGYMNSGQLKMTIEGVFPLAEAESVPRLLQGRETIGKLILKP